MCCYIIKYDVLKRELLPAAWDSKKQAYIPESERTEMITLGNARIENLPDSTEDRKDDQ